MPMVKFDIRGWPLERALSECPKHLRFNDHNAHVCEPVKILEYADRYLVLFAKPEAQHVWFTRPQYERDEGKMPVVPKHVPWGDNWFGRSRLNKIYRPIIKKEKQC